MNSLVCRMTDDFFYSYLGRSCQRPDVLLDVLTPYRIGLCYVTYQSYKKQYYWNTLHPVARRETLSCTGTGLNLDLSCSGRSGVSTGLQD
jgi:hypothetical protein